LTEQNDDLWIRCQDAAEELILRGYPVGNVDSHTLTETLYKLEIEKIEKGVLSDKQLDYNDEIVEIEEMGELETADISVSGDNLFYCNGILTKNSFGLPATADFMVALVSTEELEAQGKIAVSQLKNRYGDLNYHKRFTVGIDRNKMRMFDVPPEDQNLVGDDVPVIDRDDGNKFADFLVE